MESVGSIIMYLIIALSMIVFSVLAVTSRKILRAATYLLFTLFAAAGLYFQLDYEFLGAVQIAVYAGGILVLFVFAILLTSNPGDNSDRLASKSRVLGLIGSIAMLLVAGYSLITRCNLFAAAPKQSESLTISKIGESLLGSGTDQYLLPFEAISVFILACIIGAIVVARKR
jgi:NADH-quinone oxidoreductase subunit J